MTPPPFVPSAAQVERLARFLATTVLKRDDSFTTWNLCVPLAITLLNDFAPAIIDEGIRQRVAALPIFTEYGDGPTVVVGGYEIYASDVGHALGVPEVAS